MRLPDGYEWCCPGNSAVWGVRVVGAERMLCGEWVAPPGHGFGFCPAVQPDDPQPQCGRCVEALREMAGER